MTPQLIEKKTPMFLLFLHFTEATVSICSLKKVFTTCGQKTLHFFQWLWLLTIINFIIEQLFEEHFWMLLITSKFYSEIDSMFYYHKVRMLQKEFSQLFFAWSVKWWVLLKLWNNHWRDWINNFPCFFTLHITSVVFCSVLLQGIAFHVPSRFSDPFRTVLNK